LAATIFSGLAYGQTTTLVPYGSDQVIIRGKTKPEGIDENSMLIMRGGENYFPLKDKADKIWTGINIIGKPSLTFFVTTPNSFGYPAAAPSLELNKDGAVTFYGSVFGSGPNFSRPEGGTWVANNTNKVITFEGDNYGTGWMSHVTIGHNRPLTNRNYRLAVDGKTIIGTSVPSNHTDFKLAVDGKVVAQRYICTGISNWADTVFSDSYRLQSLDSVNKYIQKNKHLPSIPSEKEVLENGIDAADMLRMQMAKIEELYLHTIALKKDLDIEKAKNLELQDKVAKIEALEAQFNAFLTQQK
jgi:hypothetical protein